MSSRTKPRDPDGLINNMNNRTKIRIAYLGIPGSFSFIAAQKYFGKNITMLGNDTIKKVFASLTGQQAGFGVVPVENSTTGSILETYDQLMENNLSILGEVRLKIHHNLLGLIKNTSAKNISRCFSHPQAISQCEAFFEKNPQIKSVFTNDTATAAKMLTKNKKPDEAAIAAAATAQIYGLKILKTNIEDNKNNFTRFVVVGKGKNKSGNKASIVFSVKHVAGSLFKALTPYAALGLNLTKIESRPLFGKAWEYIFFADFGIDHNLSNFWSMIKQMKEVTEFITVLGIYNKGKTYET